ncbi:MAG: peptide chain release factor N(5)-glutamine methyltransferase [Kiritimatiellaceae bacterium]|nr:peptide chain release factor N(5)-glutamine methyltransferase [Kiritimatiellaceae bacterium]
MNDLIKQLEARLAAAGSGNAKRAAEELAAHVMGCRPLEIYFKTITPEQQAELEKLIVRAEQGEPIQYIIGHVDFRGLEIRCDRRALIPRPETELLVQAVLDNVDATPSSRTKQTKRDPPSPKATARRDEGVASTLKIVDVGSGTGCIALALLSELPNAEVVAVDVSSDALALAKENAERLGFGGRFTAVQGNLLNVDATTPSRCKQEKRDPPSPEATARRDEGVAFTFFAEASLDIVVSNPPYILSGVCKTLDPSVRDFEPKLALDGGADGLDLVRPLVEQAAWVLKPGGGIFLEIGYDQGLAVALILKDAGFQRVEIKKDYAGLDRIVIGFRR